MDEEDMLDHDLDEESSEHMRKRRQEAYDQADTNKDGAIDLEEYRAYHRKPMERMKHSTSMQTAIEASDRMRADVFKRLDLDKDEKLSRAEWDIHTHIRKKDDLEGGRASAQKYKHHRSKTSMKERMRRHGSLLHELRTQEERDAAFKKADADGSGTLSLEELAKFMAAPYEEEEKEREAERAEHVKSIQERDQEKVRQRSKLQEEAVAEELGEAGKGDVPGMKDMKERFDEHARRMATARKDHDERFAQRKTEIEERMGQARKRMSDMRFRQAERTLKRYDADRDGNISSEEWHMSLKRFERKPRPNFSEKEALRKEASSSL